jgi:hypothetical protein
MHSNYFCSILVDASSFYKVELLYICEVCFFFPTQADPNRLDTVLKMWLFGMT